MSVSFHSRGLIISQATRVAILEPPSLIHFSNCVMQYRFQGSGKDELMKTLSYSFISS